MIRGTAKVVYVDGTTDELHVVPFDWMRYERYCAQHKITADPTAAPATWGIYMAYSAYERAHAANGGAPGFDTWAQTVEQLDLDLQTPDPTPTAAPAE